MHISVKKLLENLVCALLFFMPFHQLVFSLINVEILSLWRDLIILAVLFTLFFRNKKMYIDKISLWIIVGLILGGIHALIMHDDSMGMGIWVNVYRVYFMPNMILFIITNMQVDKRFAKKICMTFTYSSLIISIWGIFQQFFIGSSFLRVLGVGQASVLLADGTQRNIGIFESANIMAVYNIFALILTLEISEIFKKNWRRYVAIGLLTVSIILTFSMSAILAIICVLAIKVIRTYKSKISKKVIKRALFLFIMLGIVIIMLIATKSDIVNEIYNQTMQKVLDVILTLQGRNVSVNSSAAVHYNELIEGFKMILEAPNGLGFAKESFMVADKAMRPLLGLKESSILTILFDFGIIVGLIYLVPFIKGISDYPKCEDYFATSLFESGRYISLSLLIAFVFLPLVQCYELRFFSFLFLGLGHSYSRNMS